MIRAIALSLIFTGPLLAADPVRMEWTVGDVKREALVAIPESAKTKAAPVVFAFHGHGGTMKHAANTFAYHKHWPEAICVYMQGLNAPGKIVDPDGKLPGWQMNAGELNDRDLKFFDAVLATLKKDYKADEKRIYCTGHSNGGRFTYVLWAERPEVFAAVAPSASPAIGLLRKLKPLPCLHVAGEKDQLVSYASQKATMDAVKKLNGCSADGKPWDKAGTLIGTKYESKGDAPFVSLIGPGDHKFPDEAPKLIVKFFQEHAKK
jgi:polyhydroxybutyrate depolymerase